jgi:hypothetical protein
MFHFAKTYNYSEDIKGTYKYLQLQCIPDLSAMVIIAGIGIVLPE